MGRLSSSLESALATQQRQVREAKVKERVLLEAQQQQAERQAALEMQLEETKETSFGDQGQWAKQAEAEAERRAQAEAASRAALAEAAAGAEQAEEFSF